MRIQRTITEVGRGVWNSEAHELALLTERRVYRDLSGEREEAVARYLLAFRKGEQAWNWQRFESEEERQAFLDEKLKLHELRAPADEPEYALLEAYHPAQELIESVVWSVSFIGDYLALEFDAGRLEVYDWPSCLERDRMRTADEPGYRDMLLDLLDRCVTTVDECLDAGLVVRFLGGLTLHVSLGWPSAMSLPAAATFRRKNGDTYVWERGEAPFAA